MAKRRNYKKWVVWGMVFVIIISVGVGVAFALNSGHQEAENVEETVSSEFTEEGEKGDEESEEEYSERMAEQKKIKQYEGEDPNKVEELSGAVTYAAVNNGTLMIGMNIDQYLSEGNCILNLIRNNNIIYSADSKIIAEVSTSTCDGFNVPIDGLGSGFTEIIIKLDSGGKAGIIHGEVSI